MVAGVWYILSLLATPVPRASPVVVRILPPVVASLQVVWLVLAGTASDGFLVVLCRYVGALASLWHGAVSCQLPKFMHAASYGHVLLLERHSVALHPQTSDANAAQDMPYA